MRHCKKCVMPDTRPGVYFNEAGICGPCLNNEKKKTIKWAERQKKLKEICDKYRGSNGDYYDCMITVSGGKDSHFQTHIIKNIMKMNPLLLSVQDPYSTTQAGAHNLKNISEVFECDLVTYSLNPSTTRKMVRIALEEYGSPNWPIDLAIYSIPLKIAHSLNIPFIIYGDNISYEYGGPNAEDTYSAKKQIKNNVVQEINWQWWTKRGITEKEVEMIKYPKPEIVDELDPIYLSYFYPWCGYKNYQLAKKFGFRDLAHEWKREGTIEDYDQIDSIGYLVHRWFKYPKYGHSKVSDIASFWVRDGLISREKAIELVKNHDHKLDQVALQDFLDFNGYTAKEFWDIADKFYNKDIFQKVNGEWKIKPENQL